MSYSTRRCQTASARSGPIPAGSPSVNASGCTMFFQTARSRLLVFDHRIAPQLLQIALGSGAEFLFENLVANLLLARRVVLGLPLAAHGEHLHAFSCRFGRRQMADLGAVQNGARLVRQLAGELDDLVAHRHFAQRAGERDALGAALKTCAQQVGVALT